MLENLWRLFPTPTQVLAWGAFGLGLSVVSLWACGALRALSGWRTAYTRKVNHFIIFMGAVVVGALDGSAAACAYACGVVGPIVLAVWLGADNRMYEALARERDAPRRSYYIIVPLLATAVGGIASNAVWGARAALLGYLVAGIADAIAEPVGARFGRHWYCVPSRARSGTQRSVEGSLAVLVASLLVLAGYVAALGVGEQLTLWELGTLPGVITLAGLALLFTVVEAGAPHGLDNALLQVVPAWTASALIL